jgi:hypothetical protein
LYATIVLARCLEDDDGREINGDKERLYDVSLETKRLVDIEAAVEAFKQAVLPKLTAELLTFQHLVVAKAVEVSRQWEQLWCPQQAAA